MNTVEVNLSDHADHGSHGYQVLIGSGAINQVTQTIGECCPQAGRVFVVADTGVPERFVSGLIEGIESDGRSAELARITPSEIGKSIESCHEILKQVALSGHTRSDPIVAIGGGVVGDMGGFVAASYQRGVPVIQCPTTLLSMVDASVGGKTGVNLSVATDDGEVSLLKNLVGAFHQPKAVFADMDVLESLDERYRRSGLAECVKHGMIAAGVGDSHAGLMDWMIGHRDTISSYDPGVIQELVARNVALKAEVVANDERESIEGKTGGRMLLNFGHTFGHAIETIDSLSPDSSEPDLAPLHHGEAVALGMVAACHAGRKARMCDQSVIEGLVKVLEAFELPTKVAGLPTTDQIIERMMHDKKVSGKTLRVILPIQWGKCEIVEDPDIEWIRCGIDSIRV